MEIRLATDSRKNPDSSWSSRVGNEKDAHFFNATTFPFKERLLSNLKPPSSSKKYGKIQYMRYRIATSSLTVYQSVWQFQCIFAMKISIWTESRKNFDLRLIVFSTISLTKRTHRIQLNQPNILLLFTNGLSLSWIS